MARTQSRRSMSPGLQRVRKVARKDKDARFTALLHHVSVTALKESFFALKRQAASGVDGVTWEQYRKGLEERLESLHERLHKGAYRSLPVLTGALIRSSYKNRLNNEHNILIYR